jgi:hypothetical protein
MKRLLRSRFSALLLASASVLLLTTVAAHAQITHGVHASVPFAFNAGDTKLPPGNYTIRVLDIEDPHVLTIADKSGKVEVLFTTEAARVDQAPGKTELVFDKVGDREFLSQIWLEGMRDGYQLAKSRMQLKLEKAGAKPQSHRVPGTHQKKATS